VLLHQYGYMYMFVHVTLDIVPWYI